MSDFLLDTDVLIRCLRGIPETLELAQGLTEEGELHISVWSELEVMTLAQPRDEKRTLDFLQVFISHPVTDPIAQRAAALLRAREAGKSPLSFGGALIAATAIQHGLTLVSYSPESFADVEHLRMYLFAASGLRGPE